MGRNVDRLTHEIIGAAIAVHRALGPALLESAYEACLEYELLERGFQVERQKELPVVYRGIKVDCGFRLDLDRVQEVEIRTFGLIEPAAEDFAVGLGADEEQP